MASVVEKIKKMWNPPEDEYDEYYEEEQYDEKAEKVESQPVSSYRDSSSSAPSLFKRSPKVINMQNKSQLQVVVFRPISFREDTKEIAVSLMNGNAIVLNLEKTKDEESARILDFLSGVTFAQEGKLQKIATGTFIITPHNVDISGEDIFDEFENNGIYF